jgi:hypothetical protein
MSAHYDGILLSLFRVLYCGKSYLFYQLQPRAFEDEKLKKLTVNLTPHPQHFLPVKTNTLAKHQTRFSTSFSMHVEH